MIMADFFRRNNLLIAKKVFAEVFFEAGADAAFVAAHLGGHGFYFAAFFPGVEQDFVFELGPWFVGIGELFTHAS